MPRSLISNFSANVCLLAGHPSGLGRDCVKTKLLMHLRRNHPFNRVRMEFACVDKDTSNQKFRSNHVFTQPRSSAASSPSNNRIPAHSRRRTPHHWRNQGGATGSSKRWPGCTNFGTSIGQLQQVRRPTRLMRPARASPHTGWTYPRSRCRPVPAS